MAEAPIIPDGQLPIAISERAKEKLESETVNSQGITAETVVDRVVNQFRLVKSDYAGRNEEISWKRAWFDGRHWALSDPSEEASQLVFNYTRNIVLRYVATMVRSPKPRVPIPDLADDTAQDKANRREKYLLAVWPQLKKVWRDVELNAGKLGYGVFQATWQKPKTEMVNDVPYYTQPPYKFRSLKPEDFYPVYKTYDDPNDFLYVFYHEPRRLTTDVELRYGVVLQSEGLPTDDKGSLLSSERTCELIAYWDEKMYALVAVNKILKFVDPPMGGRRDQPREVVELEKYALLEWGPHNQGRIPVWVLQNIRDADANPVYGGSLSDIDDVIDLNRHYNWIVSEEADEITTHIHRPLFYYGDEHRQDPGLIRFDAGAINPLGPYDEERIEALDWSPEPGFVDKHLDRVERSFKELSFLSDVGFGNLPAGTSGITARIAMTPFEQVIELKQPQRAETLQSVCSHLLRLFEDHAENTKFRGWVIHKMGRFGNVQLGAEDIQGQTFVIIDYGNLLPRDDNAHEQNEVYKHNTGVQTLQKTMENLGEEDTAAALARLRKEKMDPELNPEHVLQVVQAKKALKELEAEEQANKTDSASAATGGNPFATTPKTGGSPIDQPGTARSPSPSPTPRQEAPPVPSGNAFPRVEEAEGAGAPTGPQRNAPFMQRQISPNMPLERPGVNTGDRR